MQITSLNHGAPFISPSSAVWLLIVEIAETLESLLAIAVEVLVLLTDDGTSVWSATKFVADEVFTFVVKASDVKDVSSDIFEATLLFKLATVFLYTNGTAFFQ